MKNVKTTLAAILAAAALMGLGGCSENRGNKNSSNLNSNNSDSFNNPNEPGAAGSGEVTKTQYSPIALSDNNTVNSIRLFDAIVADKENAMFSPISLNMALGLIEAGAKGDSRAALSSYLRTENFADFAENYMKLAKERYTFKPDYEEQKNVLEIANSLWADSSLPVKDDYKQGLSKRFGAEIGNLDFADKENTLKAINGWVNDKTHEMIPSVLDDYGTDTAAVLINTVYFESAWFHKWTCRDYEEPFTLPDGTAKNLTLMYNGGNSYFENDKATAFSCGYRNGLEFIGILPKETGEFTLEDLDIPALLKSETYDYDVSAVMPKLNFESEFSLKDALSAAGLGVIFDPEKADFSGMSDFPLCVSEVLQNTKIELDENGTKAAAATAAMIVATGIPTPKELKTVRLDRPFAFMIYDSAEDQILFVGKVTNP